MANGAERDKHQRRQHGFGDDHAGGAVADEEGDLRRRHAEVDGDRDGSELVDGEERLDELGAVEHEDEDAVAEADATAAQGSGQFGDAVVEFTPGGGAAHEAQCGVARLHEGVPGELIGPVVPTRKIRLLGV